mgnify:CR=1 FL=1
MPVTCTTPKAKLDEAIRQQAERYRRTVLRTLQYIGERAITVARTTAMKGKDFTNQTGNLRSSIGYVVVYNGQIVQKSGFATVNEGSTGSATGVSLAERLAREAERGYVLIVVAGMHYAKYVSAKGYDVLDSAEMTANDLARQLLKA